MSEQSGIEFDKLIDKMDKARNEIGRSGGICFCSGRHGPNIALARNRLSLAKDAYRMAKVIQSRTEEEQA